MKGDDSLLEVTGKKVWENPGVVGINKETAHTLLVPFETGSEAIEGEREKSKWFRLLNGSWRFSLVDKVDSAP
ncbi:MAG TPA: hypothetical protein VHP38_09250, partial [Ruminiclostridium sp.]|nr:hypothetical protein [Ruminiclostridium sp.]